jgi:DMSO reductase anchor subunit
MLITLPLILFIIMAEVSIGSFAVLVLLDWRNEVKRGFLVSYALIYLGLTGLTYLFQQNFATPDLLNGFPQLDKAWTGYQTLPLLLFLLFMLPYNLLLLLDRKAGVQSKKDEQEEQKTSGLSRVRLLRLISGALTIAAGLATLFVMGMIYRPLGAAYFGGVFTVVGFFAASLALGGVLTAMWLGHWYLVTPALSEKPLQFATTLVLLGVLVQVIVAFTASPSAVAAHTQGGVSASPPSISAATPTPKNAFDPNVPVVAPLSTDVIGWIRILVSFIMPLVLGSLAWKLIRDRSFQSATGMLYLVVVCTLAGEAMARGLFLAGLS